MNAERTKQKKAKLMRALAGALAVDPSMSYQRLADAIGVSRRTLYRVAPSRDALVETIRQEAVAANVAALESALAAQGSALDALIGLTENFVADSDLYEFWTADASAKGADAGQRVANTDNLEMYRQSMSLLFERGRKEGVIRSDIPVTWLIQCYDGLLLAAAGIRKSRAGDDMNLPHLMMQTFLKGVGA